DDLLQKKNELFIEIEVDRIQHVKSITASSILKLNQDEIDAILVYFLQK
ncbi:15266_t:CDS:1, partial [Racocetra fulgida]